MQRHVNISAYMNAFDGHLEQRVPLAVEVEEVEGEQPREENPVLVVGRHKAGRVHGAFYKQGARGRLGIPLVSNRDIRTESIDKMQLGAEYDREKPRQTKKRPDPAPLGRPRCIQAQTVCGKQNQTYYNQTVEGDSRNLAAGPLHASAAADGGAQKQNENGARARRFLHVRTWTCE